MFKKFIRNFCVMAAVLAASPSFAASKYFFDFDNTLVENREEYGGTFQSKMTLFKVNKRSNLFQSEITSSPSVTLTWADYERVRSFLAKNSDGQGGTVGKKIKLTDGRTIEPAHYYVRTEDSFKYFFPGENGENHLLQDYLESKKRGKDKWKGKAWGLFEHLMSDPDTAKDVGILTMRAHSKQEWTAFFEQLVNDGEIKNMPNMDLIFGIPRSENDRYSYYFGSEERHMAKVNVLEEYIQMLGRVEVNENDLRLDPNGKAQGKYSQLVVAEDSVEVVESMAKLFQKYAQGKQFKIKFGLINTGYQSAVEASRRPRFTIFTDNGTARKATTEEVIGKKKAVNAAERCALKLIQVVGAK